MAFCTECGGKLALGDKFCSDCGVKLVESTSNSGSKERKKLDVQTDFVPPLIQVSAPSNARVKPVYGNGYREGTHCSNCGGKPGSSSRCNVCQADL